VRMTGQFFPLRTKIDLFACVKREVRSSEDAWLPVWSLPAVDAIPL